FLAKGPGGARRVKKPLLRRRPGCARCRRASGSAPESVGRQRRGCRQRSGPSGSASLSSQDPGSLTGRGLAVDALGEEGGILQHDDLPTSLTLLGDLNDPHRREEAWRLFLERYRPLLQGWCARRVPPGEVDDLV